MSAFTIVEGEVVPVDRDGEEIGAKEGVALVATQRGFVAVGWDGASTRFVRVHDLNTAAGTEHNLGISIRLSAPGGSVEGGTLSNPIRIDPSGTTAQPITDNGGSLTVDTPQLPGALVGGRLDTNIGTWLGSTAPTVGQKTMVGSLPVVISSDQTTISVTSTSLVPGTGATDLGKAEDAPHTSGDVGVLSLAVRNDALAVLTSTNLDYSPVAVSSAGVVRVDPSGTTTQPVSDAGGSLTTDTPQLPAALVGGRLDENLGSWLGSTAPTVGQKTMAASVPVVLASDQGSLAISEPVTVEQPTHDLLNLNATIQVADVDVSAANPVPVSDAGGSLTVDTPQLPAALVGGRLDENLGSWLGSTAPTVGQKTMAASVPVVLASDQSTLPVSVTAIVPGTGATDLGKAEDAPHTSGDVGVMALAVRNDALVAFSGTNLDYTPIAVTASGVVRMDPSGTTTQPVSDAGGSLTIDTPQLPAALVGARLDTNTGAWLGSTAPTVGQKTMASSVPVVLASDQTAISVSATAIVPGTGATNLGKAEDAPHTSGDTGVFALAVRNDTLAAFSGTDLDYTPIAVSSAGVVRIDPTGTTTQPVSGTVTANQGTAAALAGAWPVKVTDGTNTMPTGDAVSRAIFEKITDGTNTATVKAASTAAVAADPALVVAISPNNTVTTKNQELAAFTIISLATAIGNNKSMLSILNAAASTVIAKIESIWVVNVQTTAVTGVIGNFRIHRITGHSVGTAITAIETMDTADSLSASITARTGATIAGESANVLWANTFTTDEWTISGALGTPEDQHDLQTMFPIWQRRGPDSKPITLRASEGITIKFETNSTAGTFDVMAVITQE